MYHSQFLYPFNETHLDCFDYLAIMNKAVINNYLHIFTQTNFLPHLGPKITIAGYYQKSTFSFCHTIFQSVSTIFHSCTPHFLPVSGMLLGGLSPCHMYHLRGCLSVFMTWELVSPRISDLKESGEAKMSLMAKLRSHTLRFSQYLIDYTGQPYSLWEETTQE